MISKGFWVWFVVYYDCFEVGEVFVIGELFGCYGWGGDDDVDLFEVFVLKVVFVVFDV